MGNQSERNMFARWAALTVAICAVLALVGVVAASQLRGWWIVAGFVVMVVLAIVGLLVYAGARGWPVALVGVAVADFAAGAVVGTIVAGNMWAKFLLLGMYLSALGFLVFCLMVAVYHKWLENAQSASGLALSSYVVGALLFFVLNYLGLGFSLVQGVLGALVGLGSCLFLARSFHQHYIETHTRGTIPDQAVDMGLAWFLDHAVALDNAVSQD